LSLLTTLMSLVKPTGTESFTRSILNDNMDSIDKNMVAMSFIATAYGSGTVTKGAVVFDGDGKPQSQTISGPNGLTGSIIWSFTETTITETLSITAPTAFSVVKTVTLADLSEVWTVS